MTTRSIVMLVISVLCCTACVRSYAQEDPFGGASGPRQRSNGNVEVNETHIRIKETYGSLAKILEQVSKQFEFSLFEGLPRRSQPQGGNAFLTELIGKECQIRKREFFYKRPIRIVATDADKLQKLVLDSDAFQEWRGPKTCGGFHADFCLTWTNGNHVIDFLVCFGCEEVKMYSRSTQVHCELTSTSVKAIKKVLLKCHENLPGK